VREVRKSHLNYMVADTEKWEQSAGYYLDRHPAVEAWVKNAGLAFAIPYFHNGDMHDYVPDFIVRLKSQAPEAPLHATLETKGFDPLEEVKGAAAERWVAAVTADARFGTWRYHVIRRPPEIDEVLASLDRTAGRPGV
jgi:type III restriction enzyme